MKRIACLVLILGLGLTGCRHKEEKVADTRIIKETISYESKEKMMRVVGNTTKIELEELVDNRMIEKEDFTEETNNELESVEDTEEIEEIDILQLIINSYTKTLNENNWLVGITLYQDIIDDNLSTNGVYDEYAIFTKDMVELYRLNSINYIDQTATFFNRVENNEFNYYSAKNGDTSIFSVMRGIYDFKDLEKYGLNIVLQADNYNLSKIISDTELEILDFERYNYENNNYTIVWAKNNNIEVTLTIKNDYLSEIILVDKDSNKLIDTKIYGPDRDINFYNTFKNSMYNH